MTRCVIKKVNEHSLDYFGFVNVDTFNSNIKILKNINYSQDKRYYVDVIFYE